MALRVTKVSNGRKKITRVLSFTSGKGGVGKSNSAVNIAMSLAKSGKRVLLLDADLSLANIDVLLGVRPEKNLSDVIDGRMTLKEILVEGPEGIMILPASSGIESMAALSAVQRLALLQEIETIAEQFDYLLIDTPAGIGPDVMSFNSASSEIVCVITNEPTSLTDSYALIKLLSSNYGERSISILSNNVASETEGMTAFRKLAQVVERFLHIELKYLGYVPKDPSVIEAVREQRPVVDVFPSSAAAREFNRVARKIESEFNDLRLKGGMQLFFRQLLEIADHGAVIS